VQPIEKSGSCGKNTVKKGSVYIRTIGCQMGTLLQTDFTILGRGV